MENFLPTITIVTSRKVWRLVHDVFPVFCGGCGAVRPNEFPRNPYLSTTTALVMSFLMFHVFLLLES